ncbi:MAG TPA: energy-coupling factor transporter transmembrane component T [Candidatus Bathyarchaeia archaeon]|nr:MAG: hypothetical protein A3K70_04490 [Candidatus Bathyarchaeota archaeon RBG_16_48_13]HJX23148.1 energy-coupling factor transporter transmembrane component T [Candidatus Bathyarchaeia archaeon]
MKSLDGLRFRKRKTPIHRLDPRVKFLLICAIFALSIIFVDLMSITIIFLALVPLVLLAQVQGEWLRSLRASALLAAFIFVLNLIFVSDLYYALAMAFRFLVIVSSFSIFFLTTSPDDLGLALEQSHFPYEFSFAFTTAIRFVPELAKEAQIIVDAQRSRGLELEGGNILKRIRNYIPILIPLIVSAIRRSMELAEAMESRCFGAVKMRTSLHALKIRSMDYLVILMIVLVLAGSIYIRFYIHLL